MVKTQYMKIMIQFNQYNTLFLTHAPQQQYSKLLVEKACGLFPFYSPIPLEGSVCYLCLLPSLLLLRLPSSLLLSFSLPPPSLLFPGLHAPQQPPGYRLARPTAAPWLPWLPARLPLCRTLATGLLSPRPFNGYRLARKFQTIAIGTFLRDFDSLHLRFIENHQQRDARHSQRPAKATMILQMICKSLF